MIKISNKYSFISLSYSKNCSCNIREQAAWRCKFNGWLWSSGLLIRILEWLGPPYILTGHAPSPPMRGQVNPRVMCIYSEQCTCI